MLSGQAGRKALVRQQLRETLARLTPQQIHEKSIAACGLLGRSPEFTAARCVMLYLSMPQEVDTAPLALRAWQQGKSVCVPKVSWEGKRMSPVEITSLQTGFTTSGPGVREPISGKPVPVGEIDLVIVPGLGFTPTGYRIGRGMGFYDRFLAQGDFIGITCGLGFEEQVVDELPILDHDMPLSMLATDREIRRFTISCIER
ncbi:MAG: 5-formyltetrahydrofolate cyclo-ligase [Phycisphaerae bacterium]|nr:5-formyltetrahydrofolate cyclo-ligase [Phycisphaerae bacterium]MDW8261201.1 5-formyltetrahydrofolate cyclo-ligase [Phycisphaerales bacterium]